MIAELEGVVLRKYKDSVVLSVGGVGYLVHTPLDVVAPLKESEVTHLFTHLAIREHAHDLYGFRSEEERNFFELLIGISGIGPRSALAILNLADVETLRSAASSGDTAYLTKVSGIGKKNAEKIVLELRDKIGALETDSIQHLQKEEADAFEALRSLGYSLSEIREALKQIPEGAETTNERVREALKILGR
ncbi:MAG: Holliday junction branch migration protein RuvA [Candidatus Paceibacterota bacterium]